jgi:hypothetical protein
MLKALFGFIIGALLFGGVVSSSAIGPNGTPDVCSALGMPGNATTICRNATLSGEPWSYVGDITNPADGTLHHYCWQIVSNPTHAAFWCPDAAFQIVIS